MESFSFLKYLRGGAVAGAHRGAATTIAASAAACEDGGAGSGTGGGGRDVDDDASFFDLEFAVPGDESAASDAEEERVEFNFAVAAGDEGSGAEAVAETPEEEEAPAAAPGPVTKFRVLLLKLRRPASRAPAAAADAPKQAAASRFLIKFRVDDEAAPPPLFTRDSSSRTSDAADRPAPAPAQDAPAISAEERRFAREVVLRYLSKIRPLYVKVSRRYGERVRLAGEETDLEPDAPSHSPSPAPTPSPSPSSQSHQQGQGGAPAPAPAPAAVVACGVRAPRASVPAGLKQACKRLGKSRSASSAVAAAPSPPAATPQRRDDSLLQLQDGIQSAIAHCKRSFNASKGSESPLLRSMTAAATGEARDGGDGA